MFKKKSEQVVVATPATVEKHRKLLFGEFFMFIAKIAVIVVMLTVTLMILLGAYRVSDSYMEPMVKDGDLIVFNRLDKAVGTGDVVIVRYEGHVTASRVIARSGDTVDIKDGVPVVNGSFQYEDTIFYETEQISGGTTFPLVVPAGEVFVLGDQRKEAVDSRMFGCVSSDEIEGKLALVIRRRGF